MKNIDTNRIEEHGNHVRNNESEILKKYLKEIIHDGVPFCLSVLPLSCWEHKKFHNIFLVTSRFGEDFTSRLAFVWKRVCHTGKDGFFNRKAAFHQH